MNTFDFGIEELPAYLDLVGAKMQELVPEEVGGLGRIMTARGKRLRPSIVIAVAHYSGRKIDKDVINLAAAVELVHLASLVHDDVIDGGTVRHGVPTISSVEGVGLAIVAGDYLLAKGTSLACSVSAEAGRVLSEAIADLCLGQAQELTDNFNTDRTVNSLLGAVKGKTSALFAVSCVLGGMVAGLPESQLATLREFTENFGVVYQFLDDISDFTEPPELSGKSLGNDLREGNYTLPVVYSLQGPQGFRLKKLLEGGEVSPPQVLEILLYDGSIERTIEDTKKYKQKALLSLDGLENQVLAGELKAFVELFHPTEVSKK